MSSSAFRLRICLVPVLALLLGACSPARRSPQTAPTPDDASRASVSGVVSRAETENVALATRPAGFTKIAQQQAGLTTAQRRLVDSLCPLGEPKVDPAFGYGKTHVVARRGYALEHSDADRIPIWVCERLLPDQLGGNLTRANPFAPDPDLPGNARAELKDYKGSGFDRGHQAPAGDQTVDEQLKNETFYLSNMAPQAPRLNQRIWARLEDQVREWALTRKQLWAITGPLFYDPEEEDPSTADGRVEYTVLNGRVAVPTHFYKLVAAQAANGTWEFLAFVLENKGYPESVKLDQFIVSVQWLEERAGVDLVPKLPSAQAGVLSSRPSLWP